MYFFLDLCLEENLLTMAQPGRNVLEFIIVNLSAYFNGSALYLMFCTVLFLDGVPRVLVVRQYNNKGEKIFTPKNDYVILVYTKTSHSTMYQAKSVPTHTPSEYSTHTYRSSGCTVALIINPRTRWELMPTIKQRSL
jgi:hypothetical protein